jgi:hypothetical protein
MHSVSFLILFITSHFVLATQARHPMIESLGIDFGGSPTDYCTVGTMDSHDGRSSAHVCKDSSLSFDQPISTGPMGWNGFCGQTAAANVIAATCNHLANPYEDIFPYTQDLGPGTHPTTLKNGLNRFIRQLGSTCPQQSWQTYYHSDQKAFIQSLKDVIHHSNALSQRTRSDQVTVAITPAIVLVSSLQSVHWLTVVDVVEGVRDCKVVINQWSRQYTMSCTALAKIAANFNPWGLSLGHYLILSPHKPRNFLFTDMADNHNQH